MRELFGQLERIAPLDLTVLVQGETGTGKEEVARALHEGSPRKGGPFVVIDATALPETLVDALLFGHERGVFTGADKTRAGLFEAANGGTVFIDEIGELPASAQAKFLRVLERKELARVGGSAPVKLDVRVVAATHRDLRNEVEAGRFREDLFYRLAQVHLFVPPLRARLEDIELLARRLVSVAYPGKTLVLDPEAIEYLATQTWPGNVRELKNVVVRATALSRDGILRRADVAGEGLGFRGMREERSALDLGGTYVDAKERAVERFESAYLAALMKRCDGNLTHAAEEAGIARHYLRQRLRKRGLYGVAWSDDDDA
jgi:DNA-binding NtrC family response regulator